MAVTIKDVARSCGLSISTVSKVFNGYPDISEATRRQVTEAARDIGYRPNALARALKTNRSFNLGVLFVDENVSGLTHPFFAAVLNAFKAEAEARGYDITFINHRFGVVDMSYLEHCRYRNLDGACLACVDFDSAEVGELVRSDIPCVTIDRSFEGQPSVISDNGAGIALLVERAAALGHRRVAYLHGQRNSAVTEARIHSFLEAARALDLEVREGYLTPGRYDDMRANRERLARLLERDDRPTCVLLPDDAAYLGALEAAADAGLSVPGDLSLAGYDGIPFMQVMRPRLTTIRQDSAAMGRVAAQRLIERIEHPATADDAPALIPVTLVEGETLARPVGDAT